MLEDDNVSQSEDVIASEDALDSLFEVAAEHFPYPILLATTDVGEVLPLTPYPLPERHAVQVLYRGQVAGFIALDRHPGLCERIRTGNPYEAVVSENYGGRCRVLIRPVR